MKKLLLTSIFLIAFIFSAQPQEDNNFVKNKTTFGVKGGFNYGYLEDGSSSLSTINLHGGLFAETRLSKKWSFQNELMFTGSSIYNFIEIPLLLKYHINEKWSLFTGPSLDFALESNEVNSDAEALGLSFVIGTQYNLSKKFFLDARLNLGLTRQIDYSLNQNYNSFLRSTFRIGAGYRF